MNGWSHETNPIIATCTAIHPMTIAPASAEKRHARGQRAKAATAPTANAPPTTTNKITLGTKKSRKGVPASHSRGTARAPISP
ncbi:MAG: hypothetical protein U0228_14775 [Myxococcaceae bacterium]